MSSAKVNDVSKTVLITGGTGLVGSVLSEALTAKGYRVTHLSRNPKQERYQTYHWDVKREEIDDEAIATADVIIHLAGAGVANKRWNSAWKREIYDSRILSTRLLFEKTKQLNPQLQHFISASAIGYYGWDSGTALVDEESTQGEGFLADVVADWEQEADAFDECCKVCKVRIGIVLSEKAGALTEIAKPIKLGAGAALGSGRQYMSWIHIDDLVGLFVHLLEHNKEGTYNGVAPNPETNSAFTKKLAKTLKRPLILPNVPTFALRLLVGEMADILIGGNRVSSEKIEKVGFSFRYPSLDKALQQLLT